jgi:hypothetical protein
MPVNKRFGNGTVNGQLTIDSNLMTFRSTDDGDVHFLLIKRQLTGNAYV